MRNQPGQLMRQDDAAGRCCRRWRMSQPGLITPSSIGNPGGVGCRSRQFQQAVLAWPAGQLPTHGVVTTRAARSVLPGWLWRDRRERQLVKCNIRARLLDPIRPDLPRCDARHRTGEPVGEERFLFSVSAAVCAVSSCRQYTTPSSLLIPNARYEELHLEESARQYGGSPVVTCADAISQALKFYPILATAAARLQAI